MTIRIRCKACDKKLKAPDSAAGKRSRCPDCGKRIRIPERVYEAKRIRGKRGVSRRSADGAAQPNNDWLNLELSRYQGPALPKRRPCPICGESIAAGAAKCRFCGEILDPKVARSRSSHIRGAKSALVYRFRLQVHILGAVWILIGLLSLAVGLIVDRAARQIVDNPGGETIREILFIFLLVLSVTWLAVGTLTCMKQVWAIYTGLVLSYLALVGYLVQRNFCGLVIIIPVIVLAHRTLGAVSRMRDARIPLTARP